MGFEKMKLNKKSITVKWFVFYLLLFMIPMIISLMMYFRIETVLKDEIIHSNERLLSQLRGEFDDIFYTQKRVSTEIVFDTTVSDILRSFSDEGRTWQNEQKLVNLLKNLSVSNDKIDDIYVYFFESDLVVTPTSLIDGKTLYYSKFGTDEQGFEEWKNAVRKKYSGKFVLFENQPAYGAKENIIAYVQSIPITNLTEQPKGVIFVSVKEKSLMDMIEEIRRTNGVSVAVLDENGEAVVSDLSFSLAELKFISGESQSAYGHIITCVDSAVNNRKYIAAVKENDYWAPIQYVRIIMAVYVLLTIFVGICLSMLFVKQNYAPVQRIMQQLQAKQKGFSGQEDEYSFILNEIITTVTENGRLQLESKNQNEMLRQNFLCRLLKGDIREEISLEENLEKYEIFFASDRFAVALFLVEDYNTLFAEEKDISPQERRRLGQLIIGNVMEEIIGTEHKNYVFDADKCMAAIIGIAETASENVIDEIAERISDGIEFIEANFDLKLSASVSREHKTLNRIPVCFYEANDVAAMMSATGCGGVVKYSEGKSSVGDWHNQLEKESYLLNFVKIGDNESAKKLIDDIFGENMENAMLKTEFMRCMMFNLTGSICKLAEEISHTDETRENMQYFEELLRSENLLQIQNVMNEFIDHICNFFRKSEKKKDGIVLQIEQLVLENYHKQSFGVTEIGEYFHLTPSYVSKLFKKEKNELLSDYIAGVRIERAKQLIRESDDTLDAIAAKVGYLNAKALAKVFKKLEGILPSQYKQWKNQ